MRERVVDTERGARADDLGLAHRGERRVDADVAAAFDHFLSAVPPDRQLILAGHSQGALHLTRLLRDRIVATVHVTAEFQARAGRAGSRLFLSKPLGNGVLEGFDGLCRIRTIGGDGDGTTTLDAEPKLTVSVGLLVALGAVAVGFVGGLLIPSTRVEDEKIGPMADQVKDKARETGQEALDRDLEIHRLTARLRALRRYGLDLVLGSSCLGCGRAGRMLCHGCTDGLPDDARPAWPTPTPPGLAPPWAAVSGTGLAVRCVQRSILRPR